MSNNPRSGERSGEHEFKIRKRPKVKPLPPCPGCGSLTVFHPDTCKLLAEPEEREPHQKGE